jgi:hypothetical protein
MPGHALTNREFPSVSHPTGHATGAEPDPRSHLAQPPGAGNPPARATRDHDSAEKRACQFTERDSHFTPHMTFRFSGGLSPESTYLEKPQPSSRVSTLLTGYFPYL